MKPITFTKSSYSVLLACSATLFLPYAFAKPIISFDEGQASVDLRLRYEQVDQDGRAENADALTLRTRLGYQSDTNALFSVNIEMEDNRIVAGVGDYTVGPTGYNLGQYPVIADPEHTELDQGYVQLNTGALKVKAGRQVIALANQRFVGHVGWRQDRQTFDAISATYAISKGNSFTYAYIDQRNRIFAEAADIDSKDHLLHATLNTAAGKFNLYGYLLEVDNGTDNSLDTFGVSYANSVNVDDWSVNYSLEYARQENDTAQSFDADYVAVSVGSKVAGVSFGYNYELLGSDDGVYGFATPLATLHKFNGWADQFLTTPASGLQDHQVYLGGKLMNGKWRVAYHDYEADEALGADDDLGSEVNVLYTAKLNKHIGYGIKYAAYDGTATRSDTDKLWLWVSAAY